MGQGVGGFQTVAIPALTLVNDFSVSMKFNAHISVCACFDGDVFPVIVEGRLRWHKNLEANTSGETSSERNFVGVTYKVCRATVTFDWGLKCS